MKEEAKRMARGREVKKEEGGKHNKQVCEIASRHFGFSVAHKDCASRYSVLTSEKLDRLKNQQLFLAPLDP